MLIGTSSCLSLSRRVYRRLVLLKAAGSYKGAYWAAEVRIPSIQMVCVYMPNALIPKSSNFLKLGYKKAAQKA